MNFSFNGVTGCIKGSRSSFRVNIKNQIIWLNNPFILLYSFTVCLVTLDEHMNKDRRSPKFASNLPSESSFLQNL